ncbi:MAG: hypothetical protein ACLUOO_03105 [Coprococcus sp.]
MSLRVEKTPEIQLFIFNIGKIFNSKTDTQFNFHKFKETSVRLSPMCWHSSMDLVICMDEAHRYYAPASMKAINYLKPRPRVGVHCHRRRPPPMLFMPMTCTLIGAVEGYLKIPVVMGRSNMAGYNAG